MRILFICTGNICRSPLAEGILREKARAMNLHIEVDSAGFEQFHVNDPPDERAIKTGRKYGIDISGHRARLFGTEDFKRFDKIYVMDSWHFANAMAFARNEDDRQKVDYIMNAVYPGENIPVQDPWYDGMAAFEKVYHQLDKACEMLISLIGEK